MFNFHDNYFLLQLQLLIHCSAMSGEPRSCDWSPHSHCISPAYKFYCC